jgi:alcohol dehydrogenase class IV
MAIGSHLAGRAIDISKTTAPHALSYAITRRYGVSHGHAVALTLGAFIEAHCAAEPHRLRAGVDPRGHAEVMAQVVGLWDAGDGRTARDRFSALLTRIGLDPGLSRAGAETGQDRALIAGSANLERLSNNPVSLTTADVEKIVCSIG